jgi:hypothetical protein
MAKLDDVFHEVIDGVDGALGCAAVDVGNGLSLAAQCSLFY